MFRHLVSAFFIIHIIYSAYGREISLSDSTHYDDVLYDTIYMQPDTLFIIDTVVSEIESEFEYTSIFEPYYSRSVNFLKLTTSESLAVQPSFSHSIDYGILSHFYLHKFLFRTGIGIYQLKTRYDFSTNAYIQRIAGIYYDTVEVSYIQTPYNDSVPRYVIEPVYTSYSDTSFISLPYDNNYTFVKIPLYISYPLFENTRYTFFFDAGIETLIHIYSSKDNLIESNGKLISISDDEKRMIHLNCKVGFSYIRMLNESTDIMVSPFFIFLSSSIIRKDNFSLIYKSVGLHIGYIKYF